MPSDTLPQANGTFGTTLPPTPFKMPRTPNSIGNPAFVEVELLHIKSGI